MVAGISSSGDDPVKKDTCHVSPSLLKNSGGLGCQNESRFTLLTLREPLSPAGSSPDSPKTIHTFNMSAAIDNANVVG
jgi:hypothetical protein